MNLRHRIAIFSAIAVVAGISAFVMIPDGQIQNQEEKPIGMLVEHSYITTDVKEMKDLSQAVVKGKIIDKYQITQHRDEFGAFVGSDSPTVAESEPYIVYEVQPLEVLKDNGQHQTYKFKVLGGTYKGLRVEAGFDEYKIGDIVVALLNEPLDGQYYEPVTGPLAVYKLENGKAIGAERSMSESSLLQKLR